MTLRKQIEEIIREVLKPQTATDQPVLTGLASSSTERQADFDRLEAIQAEQIRELTPMREKAQALAAELATLSKQRAELQRELVATEQQRSHRHCQLSNELDLLDVKLRRSAPPAIDAFIAEMDKEAAALRAQGPSHVREVGERNLYSLHMRKAICYYSDGPSIQRRIQAVLAARRKAEDLKVEPLTEEQLADAIDQLRAGLPPIAEEMLDPWFMRIATSSALSERCA